MSERKMDYEPVELVYFETSPDFKEAPYIKQAMLCNSFAVLLWNPKALEKIPRPFLGIPSVAFRVYIYDSLSGWLTNEYYICKNSDDQFYSSNGETTQEPSELLIYPSEAGKTQHVFVSEYLKGYLPIIDDLVRYLSGKQPSDTKSVQGVRICDEISSLNPTYVHQTLNMWKNEIGVLIVLDLSNSLQNRLTFNLIPFSSGGIVEVSEKYVAILEDNTFKFFKNGNPFSENIMVFTQRKERSFIMKKEMIRGQRYILQRFGNLHVPAGRDRYVRNISLEKFEELSIEKFANESDTLIVYPVPITANVKLQFKGRMYDSEKRDFAKEEIDIFMDEEGKFFFKSQVRIISLRDHAKSHLISASILEANFLNAISCLKTPMAENLKNMLRTTSLVAKIEVHFQQAESKNKSDEPCLIVGLVNRENNMSEYSLGIFHRGEHIALSQRYTLKVSKFSIGSSFGIYLNNKLYHSPFIVLENKYLFSTELLFGLPY